jgi:streptogramin lyase
MRRQLPVGLAVAAFSLALTVPVAAQDPLDRIELPDGFAGEGITTDGSSLYAGSLANGAIWKGDPATGEGSVLVEGAEGVISVGMDVAPDGTLWVAGGPTAAIRAYDAESGELLAEYMVEAQFLNDVAVGAGAVYVTDSFVPQVVVVPLTEEGAPPAADAVSAIPITGELEYGEGFNVNGIAALPAGLVVVHSAEGALYRIDPMSGEAALIDLGDATVAAGDGIEPDGQTLHVVRNRVNTVSSFELDDALTSATLIGEVTSDDFDVPTTAALVGDDLWAVNARFNSATEEDDAYWITRVTPAGADE